MIRCTSSKSCGLDLSLIVSVDRRTAVDESSAQRKRTEKTDCETYEIKSFLVDYLVAQQIDSSNLVFVEEDEVPFGESHTDWQFRCFIVGIWRRGRGGGLI